MSKRSGSRLVLVAMGLSALLLPRGPAYAQDEVGANGAVLAAVKELTGIRDTLVKNLESRTKEAAAKGDCRDVFLRLQEGVDEQQAYLTARRRGGEWAQAYLTVPTWHLETMNEKRNCDHRNGVGLNGPDKYRFAVDMSGVAMDAVGLNGRMDALVRLNKTRDERLPPGVPLVFHTGEVYSWMDRWVPLVHEKARSQAFDLKTKIHENVHEFDLVFRKSVLNSADVYIRFRYPEDQWVRPTPWTPGFNAGFHSANLAGLSFKDGVLSGTVKMTINPDKWYPKKPVDCEFRIEGRLENGYFSGKYAAVAPTNQASGVIEGRGGLMVDGFFSSRGDLGTYESAVSGFAATPRAKIAPLLEQDAQSGETLADNWRRLFDLYRQVRAVSIAVSQYPLPVEEALRQVQTITPSWSTNLTATKTDSQLKDVVAEAADVVRRARYAVTKDPLSGVVRGKLGTTDPCFGPFYGLSALESSEAGVRALPSDAGKAGSQKWACIPEWSVAGPFEVQSDMDMNLSLLPDLVPGGTEIYQVPARFFPKEMQPKGGEPMLRGWTKMDARNGRLVFPWSSMGGRGARRGSVSFARAIVGSPKDMEVWTSIAGLDHLKLWINGRLVWVSDEQAWAQRGTEEAIVKLALNKGVNEILFRLREDRTESWLKFALCLQGAPRTSDAAASELAARKPAPESQVIGVRGDGDGHFPKANPPLAWSVSAGKNIAWKQPLPARLRGGPAAVGGHLYMSYGDSTVACLDQVSGKTMWQTELNILEFTDKPAFDGWGKASTNDRMSVLAKARINWDGGDAILSDGVTVWVHHRSGVVAAYGADGVRKWVARTDLGGDTRMWVRDEKVLLEARTRNGASNVRRAIALDAKDGKEAWSKISGPERYPFSGLLRIPGKDKAVVGLLTNDRVLDVVTGDTLVENLDVNMSSEGAGVYIEKDTVYISQLLRRTAVRFFVDGDGQVGYRHAWNSMYVTKEFNRGFTACTAGRWLLTAGTVGEDRPGHSPVSLGEMLVHDSVTGEPAGRIKPVFRSGRMDGSTATVAGSTVFVPDEGGGQMAVMSVPGEGIPFLICTNDVEAGTGEPVFDGERMFLVSAANVLAVCADSIDGKKYQEQRVAEYILDRVGLMDGDGAPKSVYKALAERPDLEKVPLARMGDEPGIINWLYAGPIPSSDDPKVLETLAGLSVKDGQEATIGGSKVSFARLPYTNTLSSPIVSNYHLLEGFGMSVTTEERSMDARAVAGTNAGQSAIFHTVIANSKPRMMTVVAPDASCRMWLGGKRIKSAGVVHIDAGYYPLTLQIDAAALAAAPLARVSFTTMDEPGAVKRARFLRFAPYLPWLERIAVGMPGTQYAKATAPAVDDIAEAGSLVDGRAARRSSRNGGSSRFDLANIPVPMTRELNLRWTADAATPCDADPIAGCGMVFAGTSPAGVRALDAKNGKELWSAPVQGAGKCAVSSPAVNNGRVCVASADGFVQCSSVTGEKSWSQKLAKAKGTPVVIPVGDAFVVQCGSLAALDATTGKVRWQQDAVKNPEAAPTLAHVSHVPVLLTSDGMAVRCTDGEIIAMSLPKTGTMPMQIDSERAFACDGGSITAISLPASATPGEPWRLLWTRKLADKAVCQPVARDGKVYVLTGKQLVVLDAATGVDEGSENLPAPAGEVSILVLSGRKLLALNLGKENLTAVYALAPALRKVWEFAASGPTGAPFFGDGLSLFSSGKTLMAVGGVPPSPPSELVEPQTIKSPDGFVVAKDAPVVQFSDNDVPLSWLVSQPFPRKELQFDCLADIGGVSKASPGPATTVKLEDKSYTFKPIPAAAFWRSRHTGGLDSIKVTLAIGATNACTAYLCTVIDVDSPRHAQFELLCWAGKNWPNTNDCHLTVWVSGKQVESGDVVVLDKGRHPITMRVNQGHVGGATIYIAPRFIDLTDSYADTKARNERQKAQWESYQKSKDQRFVLAP